MVKRTWQSRLQANNNKIAQKLADNAIRNAGTITDLIRIRQDKNKMGDVISSFVDNIDIVEIMFPALTEIEMKRFSLTNTPPISANNAADEDKQPFECYAPIDTLVAQDDIILKFFQNPNSDLPWILPLQIKDSLGSFGGWSIQWIKLKATYYDEPIPTEVLNFCVQFATRRGILGW